MSISTRIALLFLVVVLGASLSYWIMSPWFDPRPISSACEVTNSADRLRDCYEQRAKLFLEKDYAETKDLAKTFLTLLSALLVMSITFSEKIVDIHNSRRAPLACMVICWFLMLLAIIFVGAGLATMAVAAGEASYTPQVDYFALEWHAVKLFIGGCLAFGAALLLLIVAGLVSLLDKRANAAKGLDSRAA
jgi:hypothetical protein